MRMTTSEYHLSLSLKSTICSQVAGIKSQRALARKMLARARKLEALVDPAKAQRLLDRARRLEARARMTPLEQGHQILLAEARQCEARAEQSVELNPEKAKVLSDRARAARATMCQGAPRTYQGHRGETRTLLLAYAWLRGRTLDRVEPPCSQSVSVAHLAVQMETWLTTSWTPKADKDRIGREVHAWLKAGDKSRHDLSVPEVAKPARPSLLARAHALLGDIA